LPIEFLLSFFYFYPFLWRTDENGAILPLRSAQVKLAVVKARKGESIACSTVSQDGTLLAFSDQEKLRLHRLTFVSYECWYVGMSAPTHICKL
jgi:hypothetical protein